MGARTYEKEKVNYFTYLMMLVYGVIVKSVC